MFVVFEGIDGSGKTTISNLVVERLRAQNLSIKHLRAEGKFVSKVSEAIRALARDSTHLELDPHAEFLLYVARDVQLIEEALRDALRTHDVVLADRFLYTAEVLARYGRNLPSSYTEPVLRAAAGSLQPDLVVLIDVDPVLARARRKASKLVSNDERPPSRKGLSGVGLSHRLRRGYLELAEASPERWFVAHNEDDLERTVQRVTELVERAVERGPAYALRSMRAPTPAITTRGELQTPEQALEVLKRWVHTRAEREPQVAAYMLSGLYGDDVDELRQSLAKRVPTVVLAALSGLTDSCSFALREQLAAQHPGAVARSLGWTTWGHQQGRELCSELVRSAPVELARSLARIDEDVAWDLRERLYPSHPHAVAASLAWLRSARAQAMRKRWLEQNAKSLEHYETARAAARSVYAVDDELAWEIRDRAMRSAPIAGLASLAELTCERSWVLRERALRRATKVVMSTLKSLSDERAYRMRWEVAAESKEAIDSIARLDDEPAWALREAHQDVWPSTVVKTLGPLVDTPRGRALVTRQLAHHGRNLSLLKHAAAIALGVHRNAAGFEDAGASA